MHKWFFCLFPQKCHLIFNFIFIFFLKFFPPSIPQKCHIILNFIFNFFLKFFPPSIPDKCHIILNFISIFFMKFILLLLIKIIKFLSSINLCKLNKLSSSVWFYENQGHLIISQSVFKIFEVAFCPFLKQFCFEDYSRVTCFYF